MGIEEAYPSGFKDAIEAIINGELSRPMRPS
jgi:hypothetical protein